MKAVVFYEIGNATLDELKAVFPRHKSVLNAYQTRGDLLAVGTWANPREGSMAIFRDRASAEAFVAEDPFVLEKLVAKVTVKEWNETLMP